MRVLLSSDHYPPFIGGAHIQTRLIARELAERGHAVSVAAPWSRDLPAVEYDGGVEVHRLRQLRTVIRRAVPEGVQQHHPPFPDPITTAQVRRLVGAFGPDVVHSHGWIGYSVAAALRGNRVPLVLSARDYGYGCAKRTLLYGRGTICSGPAPLKCAGCSAEHYGWPKGWIAAGGVLASRRLLRARAHALHSVSHYVERMVRRDVLSSDLVRIGRVIPEAVAAPGPLTERVAADLARLPEEPYMLFVGALRHEKGTGELLEAYSRLTGDPPLLVLIGTKEPGTAMSVPPGVVVLTDFSHGAVLRAWDRALFGVFPSLLPEPLGSVVCEAMTQGRAVIGTRPGGHADVIEDGVCGLLVDQGDVEALARAMQRLVDDGSLCDRMGRAARARAKQFRIGAVVDGFEKLYRDAGAGRGQVDPAEDAL